MLSKAKIKHIQSLRLVKFRKQHMQFVAEGNINVLDFISSKLRAINVFATSEWKNRYQKEIHGISITEIDGRELSKISTLKTAPEVVAVFAYPKVQKIDWHKTSGMTIMLDDIRDPGNLGTIIRTADWFGIRQIICSEETVDAFNPKVVQASMGSLSRVNLQYNNLQNILKSKPDNLPVYGAVLDGIPIGKVKKEENIIILIGSEAHGISDKLLKFLDKKITIPTLSERGAESLNAAIATAIICYEFSRL